MTISDVVRTALQIGGKKQVELAEEWGYSNPRAISVKFNRGSWSANDLASIAEYTGGKLAILYPDGQQILVFPEYKPNMKERNSAGKE